ncbi:MAG TPA: NACHT domain-containing protein [Thermoanaerobaculia bacterium]|nr:NACHT domain-containing protein [Thermoanaerobaculia bacterium]
MAAARKRTKTDDQELVLKWLRKLPASGEGGFEGLVASLLTSLTSYTWRVASAGTQRGRDAGSYPLGETSRVVECKRRSAKTPLKESELREKLVDATPRGHALDAWVLATTIAVSDQIQKALTCEGRERGVFVEFVDVPQNQIGNLLALVVSEQQVLASAGSPWRPPVQLSRALKRLAAREDFAAARGRLERAFDPAFLGYQGIATTLREHFRAATEDRATSRAFFGQDVSPGAASAFVVPRPRYQAFLDAWWQGWSERPSVALVHGQEGSGKTWLVASWVLERLMGGTSQPPIVAWCGWRSFQDVKLVKLLAELLEDETSGYESAARERRVRRWAGRRGKTPAILLILDGLNERDSAVWKEWFPGALDSVRRELPSLGIVVTTRTAVVGETKRWLSPGGQTATEVVVDGTRVVGRPPDAVPVGLAAPTVIEIEDFDDAELSDALERAGMGHWEPDQGLRRLMRRPKYFARALRLRSQLQQTGEPTVERLLWEEMKEREQEHLGAPVSDEAFQAMLAGLARRHGSMTTLQHVSWAEIAEELGPEVKNLRLALQELDTSRIFVPAPGAPGLRQLHPERRPHALAHWLVGQVCSATDSARSVVDLVERTVEEWGDSDLVAKILSFAVCIVLVPSGRSAPPEDAAVALLAALCRLRNANQAWVGARPWAFFPRASQAFRRLAEQEWAGEPGDDAVRSRIRYCFAGIGESWADHPELVEMCERWLGFVHPEGFRSRVPGNPETRARIDAVKADPSVGWVISEVGDRSLLWLAQLALLVASHSRSAAYGRGLVSWAVSQRTMNELAYSEEAYWLARMGDNGLRRVLLNAAAEVEGRSWPHAQATAALLYRIEGSVDADRRAQELDPRDDCWRRKTPKDDDPVRAARIEATDFQQKALDPTVEVVFTKAQLALSGLDPVEVFRGRQQTIQDTWLEEMEPTLCRVAPRELASFYRAAARSWIRDAAQYEEQAFHDLDSIFLLLEPDDGRKVTALARRLRHRQPPGHEAHIEAAATGIALALMRRSADQLRFLSRRPAEDDRRDWMNLLAPLSRSQVTQTIAVIAAANEKEQRRRLMFSWPSEITLKDREREELWQAISGGGLGILSATPAIRSRDVELNRRCAEAGVLDRDHLSGLLSTESWLRRALAVPPLTRHLDPASETWLIAERGFDATELASWLERVAEQGGAPPHRNPMWPPDTYCAAMFERMLELHLDAVDGWCEEILSKSERGQILVHFDFNIVSALIVALVNQDDRRAITLVRRLGREPYESVSLRALLRLPFEAGRTATATALLSDLIARAVTDDALQVLARTADEHAATDWLLEVAKEREKSGRLLDRGRSIALRGLGRGATELQVNLAEIAARESSWVRHVADWAHRQNHRDSWARHWFRAFLREPTRERAWAAFRLFLGTATRMTGSWIHDEIDAASAEPDHEMRLRHFHLNLPALNRKLEEQGKTMEKRLFEWKVPGNDMQPWKETWHLR